MCWNRVFLFCPGRISFRLSVYLAWLDLRYGECAWSLSEWLLFPFPLPEAIGFFLALQYENLMMPEQFSSLAMVAQTRNLTLKFKFHETLNKVFGNRILDSIVIYPLSYHLKSCFISPTTIIKIWLENHVFLSSFPRIFKTLIVP